MQQLGVAATHYDKMSSLANEKFAELMTNVAEPLAGRKVLAAIIMTCDSNEEETMVISVGMGNMCYFFKFCFFQVVKNMRRSSLAPCYLL